MLVPTPKNCDPSVRQAIVKLASLKLGPTSEPTFAGLSLTSPLAVSEGGTGIATLTDHGILLGSGTGAITPLGVATHGQIPIGSTGADPVLAAITGTANQVNISNAAGSITLSTPQDIDTGADVIFASVTLVNAITEFSTDGTMGDNSDGAVPTEAAIVTYCAALGGTYQPLDAVLTDLAALPVVADNEFIVGTGAGAYAHESGATARGSMGLTIGTHVQAYDAGLASLAGLTYAAASFIKMTGTNTFALRTIGETADDLEETIDHDAVGGTITHSTDNLTPASITLPNTGLHLLDTNASHDLIIAPGSDLSADKTLTLTTGDFDRTITLSGNPTLADWFDQSVKQAATPTFAGIIIADGGTIRCAGAPVLTFDDTNDYLEITGCKVGIGTATPGNNLEIFCDAHYEGVLIKSTGNTVVSLDLDSNRTNAGYTLSRIRFLWNENSIAEINALTGGDTTDKDEGSLRFRTAEGGSMGTRMTITQNGRVGIGTATPAASAKMEIASTTGAFVIPRMTEAQRDALTPVVGMIIFNTTRLTSGRFQAYRADGWNDFGSS